MDWSCTWGDTVNSELRTLRQQLSEVRSHFFKLENRVKALDGAKGGEARTVRCILVYADGHTETASDIVGDLHRKIEGNYSFLFKRVGLAKSVVSDDSDIAVVYIQVPA